MSDHGDDAGVGRPPGWFHADQPLVRGAGLTDRLRRWLLIDGNRWLLAALLAGFVFASVLVVGTLDGGIRAAVRSKDPIETGFIGLATGIITGVTLVVTIDRLVLSRQLGSLAEQRERLDESLGFHREVEQLVEETSPAEPGRFLAAIVDTMDDPPSTPPRSTCSTRRPGRTSWRDATNGDTIMPHEIGLIGYGRIGEDLADRVRAAPDTELAYVYVRSPKPEVDEPQLSAPEELAAHPVDLVVEAATPAVLAELAEPILVGSDLLALSGSAFADPEVEDRLTDLATASEHDLYLPHAALFGVDGLVDARESLQSVHIEARKAPDHLDFEYADAVDPAAVEGGTVLYEGPTRGLCQRFPRNFNSHAAMALAGLGLDATTSRLIVDPDRASAEHVVTATGPGFELEAVRDSAIEGVTGDYTLVSTWGSVRRVLGADEGLRFL